MHSRICAGRATRWALPCFLVITITITSIIIIINDQIIVTLNKTLKGYFHKVMRPRSVK